MSKTNSLHYDLCVEGAKWLRKQKWNYDRCQKKACYRTEACGQCKKYRYVAVELCTWDCENTDVWGLGNFNDSAVIEVKVSHSDFLADKKKFCRSDQAEKLKYQAGRVRWYLCPEGVIKKEELPEKWGLLYWDGKKVYPVVAPKEYQNTSWADMQILTSILRREGFREGIFNYRGRPSTIQGKTINGIPEREWIKQQKNNK